MIVLLPPSETKQSGGAVGTRLDLGVLGLPELTDLRKATIQAVLDLAEHPEAMTTALRLGPTQAAAVDINRGLVHSPTMAAVARYTGVLYDALDVHTLATSARSWIGERLFIGTALLGPIGALDPIPDHRLSHDSRLPGLALRAAWAGAASRALASLAEHAGMVLDARSAGYVRLAPAPGSVLLRVITERTDGRMTALSHANKRAKGLLVRSLARSGENPGGLAELVDLLRALGWRAATRGRAADGRFELDLLVPNGSVFTGP